MIRVVGAVIAMCFVAALVAGCKGPVDAQRAIAKAQEYREKGNKKAAIIEVKNILQSNPGHAEARYLLGLTYYEIGDYRLAEQELRRALDLSFERSKVMPVLGKSMVMLGEYQKVIDQVPVEAHAGNAVQADILTVRARALMGLKRVGPAQEVLAAALAKQPEFADALVEQARLAVEDQKLDESARLIQRAIASAPRHVQAWLMKGDLARVRAAEADAMVSYQKVLEFDPANVPARLNITSLHILGGRFDEARKLIKAARALEPGNILTIHMQALVEFQTGDHKAANDTIQQVLKVAPNYMPSALLAGAILTELGSFEQAQQYIGRALEQAPGNVYARRLLAMSLARSGQMQRAIETLQPALKQAPPDHQVVALAGELFLLSGEFGKAAALFDMVATLNPKDAAPRAKLGMSRMAAGDADGAVANLEAAIKLGATDHHTDMLLIVSHLKRGSHDQALKAMEGLEKKQPNSPLTFNLKGGIFNGMKDVANARKSFEHALKLQPTFLAAAINLMQLDLLDKNAKSARGRLESILEKDKDNVQALHALAEFGPLLGATTKEQVDWLERARKANAQSVPSYLMLTALYLQSGDKKKALEVAQQGQAASPENPQLLDLLGATQLNVGQKDQALASFRKLVQLQPKSPVAFYRLASAQEHTGDFRTAAETQRKVLSLAPDFKDAQLALVGLEIRAGRYSEAMGIARHVQKQDAKSPFGFALEGQVLTAEKKHAQAAKAYETAHGIAKNSTSLINLLTAHTSAGNAQAADMLAAQWLKGSPDDPVIRLYAADAALKRRQFKEAITHYEWMQQKQPDNLLLLNNLAWAYYETKDPRALATAEKAHKLAPDNAAVADTLGWLLIEQGNTARGIEVLEKALKGAPNKPGIRYHLAQGWVKAGDKSKAREELERVVSSKDNFPHLAEAKNLLSQLRK